MTQLVVPAQKTVTARWHGGKRRQTTHCVWHATAGGTALSSLGWLNRASAATDGKGQAGYHALIERDGTIYWHTPHDHIAYHAGVSAWPYPNGAALNARSVGIGFANRQVPTSDSKFEAITPEQQAAARWVLRTLAVHYPALLSRDAHLRHRDCAPTRRSDPTPETRDWPAFLDFLFA